jgi:RimJ/RimL family protein N-acetyltransferase
MQDLSPSPRYQDRDDSIVFKLSRIEGSARTRNGYRSDMLSRPVSCLPTDSCCCCDRLHYPVTPGIVEPMTLEAPMLQGRHVRLEPLQLRHAEGLAAASDSDPSLYQWTTIPRGELEAAKYINTAMEWLAAGQAVAFAIVRISDGVVIGSTRFFDLERWTWPEGHLLHGRSTPDVSEIGYTWLTRSAIRTAANTEAKLLMLTYAFETWEVLRVCLHTDVRNQRSRDAIERIGGQFEGILRAHRMAADFVARDSARYSILASEWPSVKQRLLQMVGEP